MLPIEDRTVWLIVLDVRWMENKDMYGAPYLCITGQWLDDGWIEDGYSLDKVWKYPDFIKRITMLCPHVKNVYTLATYHPGIPIDYPPTISQ